MISLRLSVRVFLALASQKLLTNRVRIAALSTPSVCLCVCVTVCLSMEGHLMMSFRSSVQVFLATGFSEATHLYIVRIAALSAFHLSDV